MLLRASVLTRAQQAHIGAKESEEVDEDKQSWEGIGPPGVRAPGSLPVTLGCRRSGLSVGGCLWWQESSTAGRSRSKESCSGPPTGVFTLHRCHKLKRSPLYRLSMELTIPGLPEGPFGLSVKATTASIMLPLEVCSSCEFDLCFLPSFVLQVYILSVNSRNLKNDFGLCL